MKYLLLAFMLLVLNFTIKAQTITTTINTVRVIKNPGLNKISVDTSKSQVSYYIYDTLKVFKHPFDSLKYEPGLNKLTIFYKLTKTLTLVTDIKSDTSIHRLIIDLDTKQTYFCNGDTAIAFPYRWYSLSVDSANTIKHWYYKETTQ